jgi:mannose-6-phosphate isomerase-like protein (cupin superfamily)
VIRAVSPLETWFPKPAAPGARARVFPPRNRSWRSLAPSFAACLRLARAGLPFQIVRARRYDRSGDPRKLPSALTDGATVYFPQIHQVLPRLARLQSALERACLGPRLEAFSYLFLVEGRGREGMGLHHDGEVDSFWLQLEGRRTVTVGPPVSRGAPPDLEPGRPGAGPGWRTLDLEPGSLFYLPPRTPHRVVCRGRSLAVSLTWSRAKAGVATPPRWERAAGTPVGPERRGGLWTQVPVRPLGRSGRLLLPGGTTLRIPGLDPRLAEALARMSRWPGRPAALERLEAVGLLAPKDLPLAVRPARPRALDGWNFR